jgi:energy-coupling factor transporter ATP-binding protein EcfA2
VTDAPPFPWKIGDHVMVIGDTGTGKSTLLAKGILPLREYVVVFLTKKDPRDTNLWESAGYRFIRHAKDIDDERYSRFVLQPRYSEQTLEGWRLFEKVYRQGRWTIVVDEFFLATKIGLGDQIDRLHTQGRSDAITVVVGQQRPVATSRFAISQSTHVFTFAVEGRDADTLAEAATPRFLPLISERWRAQSSHRAEAERVPMLRSHEFAYYHRGNRVLARGYVRTISGLLIKPGIGLKSSPKSLDSVPA